MQKSVLRKHKIHQWLLPLYLRRILKSELNSREWRNSQIQLIIWQKITIQFMKFSQTISSHLFTSRYDPINRSEHKKSAYLKHF
jgi:hypothetical protein